MQASNFWARSPSTGSSHLWTAQTRRPYRSIDPDNDYLDMLRYVEMARASAEPNATDTQNDEINTAAQDAINDFLAEFKIVERKAG